MTFLKNKLLEKIKEGEIKLKPKWIFVARFSGLLIGAILSILITIFFVSIVLFMIFYNKNGLQNRDLLTFKMLFQILPWMIIGLSVVFVAIFEMCIKKLLPVYRKPMLTTLVVLGALILVISLGVNQNKAFKNLCTCGASNIKPLEWIMKNYNEKYASFVKTGKVVSVDGSKIVINIDNNNMEVDKSIFCQHCLSSLSIGDSIYISGINTSEGFKAIKGKKSNNDCASCNLENEIKSNDSCNNIWKGR